MWEKGLLMLGGPTSIVVVGKQPIDVGGLLVDVGYAC